MGVSAAAMTGAGSGIGGPAAGASTGSAMGGWSATMISTGVGWYPGRNVSSSAGRPSAMSMPGMIEIAR